MSNQVRTHDRGHLITGPREFNNGKCVIPLILNLPGQDVASQTSNQISKLVRSPETTAQLRIMGAKSVTTSF